MTFYLLEPRDTALFRDARPFTASSGAETMEIPWPSTIAGLFRNRAALDEKGRWAGDPKQVLTHAVAGPWLAELHSDGTLKEYYFPAPADAVFFSTDDPNVLERRQLSPEEQSDAFASDLPTMNGGATLLPVVLHTKGDTHDGKPTRGPTWWKESVLRAWLQKPTPSERLHPLDVGIQLPPAEERVHVGIDEDTGTAEDGQLFVTAMQRFRFIDERNAHRRFAIAAYADPAYTNNTHSRGKPQTGSVALGGERRISIASKVDAKGKTPLQCSTQGSALLRVTLLTPGLFQQGWHPSSERFGGGTLIAACTSRPQAVSGWDLEARGPKPTRFMVPAGATYWVRFENEAKAKQWMSDQHFTCISDHQQDRLDGFGLVAVGRGT